MNAPGHDDAGHVASDSAHAFWRVLRRRWYFIVLNVVFCVLATYLYTSSQPKEYTATSSLLFRSSGLDQSLSGAGTIVQSFDPGRDANTNAALVSLDSVSERAARQLGLPRSAVRVAVAGRANTNIVDINAISGSPATAANVANAVAEQFISSRREAQQALIRKAGTALRAQASALAGIPDAAERRSEFLARAEQLEVLAALQTGNAEVAAEAVVPGGPSGPRVMLNTLLGGMLGLLLGLAQAFAVDRLDTRVRTASELEALWDAPILARVPEARNLNSPQAEGAQTEAFRLLRARLRYFNVGRPVRTVLVTSAVPGEGKSTTSLRLAEAMNASGSSVVLLELDMRRPVLAHRLGLDHLPGLSELLTGNVDIDQALKPIPDWGNGELMLLPAGGFPPNPSELLESEELRDLLRELGDRFDYVVVDSPPIEVVSDAIPVVGAVDGVVMVGRLTKVTRDQARRLKSTIEGLGGRVLGGVINGIPTPVGGAYNHYYDDRRSRRPRRLRGARASEDATVLEPTNWRQATTDTP